MTREKEKRQGWKWVRRWQDRKMVNRKGGMAREKGDQGKERCQHSK
jgi:hypothetical protein